jgi:arginine/lysine/ornithine decarboxylase
MDESLLEKLENYCPGAVPMHMPGHKRNDSAAPYLKKLSADIDITEIDGFDNLHCPEGVLRDSMERAAAVWSSKKAFFLVGGSSAGILASIFAVTGWHDKVIMARNCHKAVYNGVNLRQLEPVYILPQMLDGAIAGEITAESVKNAFEENKDAKVLILTSPTYEGVVSDIAAISQIAHRYGAIVIVDEAHGAHLGFGYGFPDSAINCGGDIVVQSLHKTMLSLTQTAMLHVCSDRVDTKRIAQQLAVFQTSSPSYLLMASIDGCVRDLEKNGHDRFARWRGALDIFYEKCAELEKLRLFDYPHRDRSKLVVLTAAAGMTGSFLAEKLRREYSVELEMASLGYAVAMTGMGDSEKNLNIFANALLEIDRNAGKNVITAEFQAFIPRRTMLPWQTENADGEFVQLSQSVGRTSLEYVWAYPPGIPMIVPGEVIEEQSLQLLYAYKCGQVELKSTCGGMPEKIFVLKM